MGSFLFQEFNLCVVLRLTRRGDDSTVAPDKDQSGAEPETERESEIGNAGAVNSEAPTELEEFSGDTNGASDADVRLKLIGTAIADDPELSMANIEIRGTRQQSYFREGDWIGGVRTKKILLNRLIVDYGKKAGTPSSA